jgi:hypothetical protein
MYSGERKGTAATAAGARAFTGAISYRCGRRIGVLAIGLIFNSSRSNTTRILPLEGEKGNECQRLP